MWCTKEDNCRAGVPKISQRLLIAVLVRSEYGIFHQDATKTVCNKDNWSPTALPTHICDCLEELLGMLTDGHISSPPCIEVTRVRIVAVGEYPHTFKVFHHEI